MASWIMKIIEMVWGNTSDLQKPYWKNHPIQAPYWSRKWEWPWAVDRADISDGLIVADMGSGNMSPISVYLGKIYPSIKIYAVDLNLSPFPDTKQIKTLQENLIHTSIPSSSVDRVICISTLEHMGKDNWIPAMEEFKRILKPEGKIILTVDVENNRGSMWNFKKFELEWFIKNVDPNAIIPTCPLDILDSASGNLPGECDLNLTVLGIVLTN